MTTHYDDLKSGALYRDTANGEFMRLKKKWTQWSWYELEFEPITSKYVYCRSDNPEFDLEQIEILSSQVWSPRRNVEYVEVEWCAGGVVEFVGCVSGKRDQLLLKNFLAYYELPKWSKKESAPEPGVYCCKCKKFFKYADNVMGFECWACKNGY